MVYDIEVSEEAQADLESFLQYIIYELKNEQAAKNVLDDFDEVIDNLQYSAGSIRFCENPRLNALGYKRINFQRHDYFMMFRIDNNVVCIDNIFHAKQDFENKMI